MQKPDTDCLRVREWYLRVACWAATRSATDRGSTLDLDDCQFLFKGRPRFKGRVEASRVLTTTGRRSHLARIVTACVIGTSVLTTILVAGVGVKPAGAVGGGWDGFPANLPTPSGYSDVELTAVSCTSATACTAVGDTYDPLPVAEQLSGTTWTAANLPLPSGQTHVELQGISCASSTTCIAVGTSIPSYTPVAEQLSGTTWTAVNLPLPSGQGSTSLYGISCTSSTACVAVGLAGTDLPVAEQLSGTTWTAVNLPLPSGQVLSAALIDHR
jgi:hypothetical protein